MKYETLTSKSAIKNVMDAVKQRGITPELVDTKDKALWRLEELIPQELRSIWVPQQRSMRLVLLIF